MPCKSTNFKNFQKRIRRTLNYGVKRNIMSAQISRMLSTFLNQGLDLEMADKLAQHGYVSPYNMLTAIVYITRLKRTNEQKFLEFNSSEIYLSTLILATKFLSDGNLEEFVWNDEWATVSGLTLPELNQLELQTLQALNWDVFVSEECFEEALVAAEEWVALDLWRQNGQLTYKDMLILSRNFDLARMEEGIRIVVKLLLYLIIAYTAIILLLIVTTAYSIQIIQKSQVQLDLLQNIHQCGSEDGWDIRLSLNHPFSIDYENAHYGSGCIFGNWSVSLLPSFASFKQDSSIY